ncbi:MAG TPA: hypothetical protein PK858_04230, partial [Saprospiraceae bacterium]|nr:hypothetical protein [Saprospiraceae bacterium]
RARAVDVGARAGAAGSIHLEAPKVIKPPTAPAIRVGQILLMTVIDFSGIELCVWSNVFVKTPKSAFCLLAILL